MPNPLILVVDDNRVLQHVIRHILQKAGYQITLASDGEEAYQCLREVSHHLVVTDMEMPVMNGVELVQAMRKEPDLAAIPVIMVTATGDEANVKAARSVQADGFLTRPIASINLLQEVERLLVQAAVLDNA